MEKKNYRSPVMSGKPERNGVIEFFPKPNAIKGLKEVLKKS